MKKNIYFQKRREEIDRLRISLEKNPNYTSEMIEKFKTKAMEDILEGEREHEEHQLGIKYALESIKKTLHVLVETKTIENFKNDSKKVLKYYQKEMFEKKRKTCFFQENVICEIERTNNLFFGKILQFSNTCYKIFFKEDAYAGLILLRSNIENLFLYHYYIEELEKFILKKQWLKIARLNARILHTKKNENLTRFEAIENADYLETVSALVTLTGAEDKPFHIDLAKKQFFENLKNNQIQIKNLENSSLVKEALNNPEMNSIKFNLTYHEIFYDQLSEIVHPVAIERNRYPFDCEDPNVLNKFSFSYSITPYVFNLYLYGINLYEKVRNLNYKEINIIEKNLSNEIERYTIQGNKDYFLKIIEDPNVSEHIKKIIKKNYTSN